MALLELKDITAGYGQNIILRDFNLSVERGEFVSLLGSSGCGKTTTLRMIAGFSEPNKGTITFDGKDYTHVPLHKRNFGFVFQSYALFPHMTVFDNVAFGLKMRKLDKETIRRDVMEMLRLVDLEGFENRYPREMSGGQRQRVALARAMVIKPDLMLFDEPLSNLDAKLRVSMRSEISKLHRQLGSTTIYVTHDQVEAMTMADRIVIMKDGVIQQVGKPMDLYEHPANKFVAGFIGSPQMNFYEVKVAGNTMTFSDGSKMQLPESVVTSLNGRQGTLVLGIRGEDIKLDPQNLDLYKDNIMSATVDSVEVMGNENNLYFNFGGTASVARVSKYEISKPGDTIDFAFVPSRMHFFDTQTEESLF